MEVLTELEGAVERASDTYGEKKQPDAADREPPADPAQ
jgi:hypothetical protein